MNSLRLGVLFVCSLFAYVTSAQAQDTFPIEGYYLLAQKEDHCGNITTYYAPKQTVTRRAAMALYQIIHFALPDKERLTGQEQRYIEQFGLKYLPNDMVISRWNQMVSIVPYSREEMQRAARVTQPTNNPVGDIRSWFYSDLAPKDQGLLEQIIRTKNKTALESLLDQYDVVQHIDNTPNCD